MKGVMTPFLIAGPSGSVREAVESVPVRAAGAEPGVLRFLDDDAECSGPGPCGIAVPGSATLRYQHQRTLLANCRVRQSNPFSRRQIAEPLVVTNEPYGAATARSSAADWVSTTDVAIGQYVAMMPTVVLTQDDAAGDYVVFGAYGFVAGGTGVDSGAYMGADTRIRERPAVGTWAIVGIGAVLAGDVPTGEVWAGVAGLLRCVFEFPAGWSV